MSDSDDEAKDWVRCATWLMNCMVLSKEQVDMITSVIQLALHLRDGVLLCLLLNRLHQGAVDPKCFSQRPQMSQFLCLKNIRVFLQSCRKVFGMKESALFDPSDLFEMLDFNKVVAALSSLSKTKEAKKSGIEPFSIENDEIYTIIPSETMDDDIYTDHIYGDASEDADEDVYGQLIEYRPKSRVQPAMSKRDHCVKEIVDTERNYVEVLNMIVEKFIEPLKSVLQTSDVEVIFRHVTDLRACHRDLLSDLAKASCSPQSSSLITENTIPGCFIKHKMNLVVYGKYCANLTSSHDRMEQCLKSENVRSMIEKKNEEAKVKLRDLLIVPFQRILKYHLLVGELRKHTDERSPEMPVVDEALTAMLDLSMYVNEVKRDSENLALISDIESSIVDLNRYLKSGIQLKDYGRRLHDGELKMKAPKEKKFETRYIFLFDKVMLICRSKGDFYYYIDFIILSHYGLQEQEKEKTMYCFALVGDPTRTDVSGKTYMFGAKSQDQIRKWMDTIDLAKSNFTPTGFDSEGHCFCMQSFDQPTSCDVCKKLLKGVFYQGYKCRNTGLSVHKECIQKASESKDIKPKGKVKAVARYDGRPPPPGRGRKSLLFEAGAVIIVMEVSDSWLQGRLGDDVGYFPKDNVRTLPDKRPPSYVEPTPAPKKNEEQPAVKPPLPSRSEKPQNGKPSKRKTLTLESSELGQLWFAGPMSRPAATSVLEDKMTGTFLIRFSPEKNEYALSLKHEGVRHMRINKDDSGFYVTTQILPFDNLLKLVDYYSKTSLQEAFPKIQTCLTTPYQLAPQTKENEPGVIGYCIAIYDYAATESNQLTFSTDDRIAIMNKTCSFPLWWKGRLNGKVGYIPSNYVKEL